MELPFRLVTRTHANNMRNHDCPLQILNRSSKACSLPRVSNESLISKGTLFWEAVELDIKALGSLYYFHALENSCFFPRRTVVSVQSRFKDERSVLCRTHQPERN
jgi:hypothetical protein